MIEIRWTEPALNDLRAIRDYISRDSAYYAEKVVDEAFDKVERLSDFPNMGRQVPEENDSTIREIIHYSYRIIYETNPYHITVLAIVHGKQEYISPKGTS